jgi:hypothetical protein
METPRPRVQDPPISILSLFVLLAACGANSSQDAQGSNPDASSVVIGLPSSDALLCMNTPSPANADASGTDPLCDPNAAQVSYAKDIEPVLMGCSGEVCHASWNHDTVVNRPSSACCDRRLLVAPFHPSLSLLTQSLTGTDSCVGTMPQGGHLPTPQIQAMIAWVCQGAPNN